MHHLVIFSAGPASAPLRFRLPRRAVAVLAAVGTVLAGTAVATSGNAAATVPSCSATGITVTALHGPVFYVDLSNSPKMTSAYAGYQLTNATGAPLTDAWVQLSDFTGGSVALGSGQPAAEQLANFPAGSSKSLFWYLTASAESATAQNHTVTVYSHQPGLANATVLCSTSGGFSNVSGSIGANANKIDSITLSSATPTLGATFSITVQGNTGTIGQGPAGDFQSFWMSPSSIAGWPAGAFRLVGTKVSMLDTTPATTSTDVLHLTGLGSSSRDYSAVYTFQATGFTPSDSTLLPVEQIASGTQIKHTGSYPSTIPAIKPASNDLSVAAVASPNRLPSSGGTSTYTATIAGTTGASLDSFTLTAPSGVSVVPGSATYDGSALGDPVSDGHGHLVFQGPFTLTAGTDTVSFQLSYAASSGAKQTSIIGSVGTATIDTTPNNLTDNVPATATVVVNTPPSATNDSTSVATNSAANTIPVLANDTDADHDTLSVTGVTQPENGTATWTSGAVGYTPMPGYIGTDSFDYSISDGNGGTATGTVTVDVSNSLVAQAITFPPLSDATVLASPVVTATSDSGLPVSYSSLTQSVCTVDASSGAVTLNATGTCTLQADQDGDGTHSAAPSVQQSFTVTKAGQAITFPQPSDVALSAGSAAVAATADSALPVALDSQTPSTCTVANTGVVTLLATGDCTIEATQPGSGGYAAATPVSRTFTITRTAQTITFPALSSTQVTDTSAVAAAVAGSALPITYTSLSPAVCSVAQSGALTFHTTGTCELQADQAGNNAYAAAPAATMSFQVVRTGQTIDLDVPSSALINATDVAVSGTATSGLPVSYASSTPGVCTVAAGGGVTLLAAGTCTITASQDGSPVYEPAEDVQESFPVALVPQTITLTAPEVEDVSIGTVSITATSNSGLPVTVSAGPARVCTLADDTLTLLRPGHCQLEATAAGNATYLAAPAVDAAVEVTAQITDKTYTLPAAAAGSGSHGATTINVLKGDHGQTLVGVTQPPHGHVKIDGTRLVVNVPAGYKGTETFTYTTQDASGRQHTATVTINVPNSPPTIESMSTKTIAGSSRHLVVPVADANHDNLTVTVGKHAGARVIVVRHRLRITPDRSFSGRLTIPVTVRDGDGGVATATVHVLVSPRPTRSASRHLVPLGTRIAWPAVPTHGARYAVTVDGRRMCVTAALSCTVGQFLGAHAHVKVTVYGLDGTRSTLTPATPHRSRPQLAGTVYFATDSSVLSRHQAAIARALARRALKYGFRSVALVGYTDSRGSLAYNEALSHRRSRTVAHLLRTGFHLSARLAWRGEGSPAATNATVQGMALNRRVELWLG